MVYESPCFLWERVPTVCGQQLNAGSKDHRTNTFTPPPMISTAVVVPISALIPLSWRIHVSSRLRALSDLMDSRITSRRSFGKPEECAAIQTSVS